MAARRAGVTAVLGVVAGLVVVLGLVTWASSIGPSGVISGSPSDPAYTPPTPSTSATEGTTGPAPPVRLPPPSHPHGVWRWLVVAVRLAMWVGILYVLVRILRWLLGEFQASRTREVRYAEAAFDVLESPAALARALSDDEDRQREPLMQGMPRNAIVACWDRFEEQASLAGAARREWETSSEFTIRVLDHLGVDSDAVVLLERLYHEARFSDHQLGEEARGRALEALDRIHESLRSAGSLR